MATPRVRLAFGAAAAALVGSAVLSGCTMERPALPDIRTRTVAFDNTYGARTLRVHVRVDEGAEVPLTASCDAATCTFHLLLTSAPHDVTVAVEVDGKRSVPIQVKLDATQAP